MKNSHPKASRDLPKLKRRLANMFWILVVILRSGKHKVIAPHMIPGTDESDIKETVRQRAG